MSWQRRFRDGRARRGLRAPRGFYGQVAGRTLPFHVAVPPELGAGSSLLCRFADDLDLEQFMALLFATQAFRLVSVRG